MGKPMRPMPIQPIFCSFLAISALSPWIPCLQRLRRRLKRLLGLYDSIAGASTAPLLHAVLACRIAPGDPIGLLLARSTEMRQAMQATASDAQSGSGPPPA